MRNTADRGVTQQTGGCITQQIGGLAGSDTHRDQGGRDMQDALDGRHLMGDTRVKALNRRH